MIINFDYFNRAENPDLSICKPNNIALASIPVYDKLVIKPTFNGLSELSVNVYKYIEGKDVGIIDTSRVCECYKYLDNFRQIHVENLGYFVIQSCQEINDGINPYMEITAKSCEIELNSAGLNIADGTYQFYNTSTPSATILGKIINLCPNWKIGNISDVVANRYRTFKDLNQQVYAFMAGDMLTAYECIVNYDIENRVINVIDSHSEIESTDIFLTFDTVIKNAQVNQSAENIVTALEVTGANNLEIRNANPLGTNVIYNLDYYKYNPNDPDKEWMSEDLTNAVNTWQKKISDNTANYNNLISQITTAEVEYSTLDGQLADLITQLKSLKQVESTTSTENYATAHANVVAQQALVNSKQTEVNNKQSQITNLQTQLTALQTSLNVSSNFTVDQYKELVYYIHQDKYQDENIEVTDAMDYTQRQAQIELLYERGKKILDERSQPTYTITFDCNNFLFIKEFNVFRDQLELGKIIHVEISPDNIVDFALLQYEIDYDDKSLKMTISNRLKLHSDFTTIGDLQSQITQSTSDISFGKDDWYYPTKSGILDDFDSYMKSSLNIYKNPLIAADGQKAVFDDCGYHGFRWNASTGTYDPEQCQLVNNELRFTKDNWNTIACAFGKIKLSDGSYVYGFNGDVIVAGKIQSHNGKVYFDLDNNRAAVSRLIDAGDSGIYVDVGTEEPQYGQATGLFIYHEDTGKFAQIYRMIDSRHDGAQLLSLGPLSLLCCNGIGAGHANAVFMDKDSNDYGTWEFKIATPTGANDFFSVDSSGTELLSPGRISYISLTDSQFLAHGNSISLMSNIGETQIYIDSSGIYFAAGGVQIAHVDTAGGWNGKVNGYSGASDDITIGSVTLHFREGIYTGSG